MHYEFHCFTEIFFLSEKVLSILLVKSVCLPFYLHYSLTLYKNLATRGHPISKVYRGLSSVMRRKERPNQKFAGLQILKKSIAAIRRQFN